MKDFAKFVVFQVLFASSVLNARAGQWEDAIGASNPLNWWRFEETSGTVAVDSGNESLNGTYIGGLDLDVPGLVGRAARFDGIDDFIQLGGQRLTREWTVEAIFRAGPGGDAQALLGDSDSTSIAIMAEQLPNTGMLGYSFDGQGQIVGDVSFNAQTPSRFVHVVVEGVEGSSTRDFVALYINSRRVESNNQGAPDALSRNSIGRAAGTPQFAYLDGEIDELVIYDRRLPFHEILRHARTIGVPEPGSLPLAAIGVIAALVLTSLRFGR